MRLRSLCSFVLLISSVRAQSRTAAFTDVTVVPMDSNQVLAHRDVLITGERITSIAPTGQIKIPAPVRRIDGRGKYLFPGLADMHVHLNEPIPGSSVTGDHPLLYVANGVTTVRNMFGTPQVLELRNRILAGDRIGPTIYTTGPLTDGAGSIIPGSRIVRTAAEAAEAVSADRAAGYDAIKVYGALSTEAYDAIVLAARQSHLPVYGHVPNAVGVQGALEARQDSLEHLIGFTLALQAADSPYAALPRGAVVSRKLLVEHADLSRLDGLAKAIREAGVWNCPTLTVLERSYVAGPVAQREAQPEVKFVDPQLRNAWKMMWMMNTTSDARLLPFMMKVTAGLHKRGARLIAGTDAPNPYVVPGFSLHEELRRLVEAGLSPYDALRTATADAAEFMKLPDQFGKVAPGARADLILTNGNPLEDVAFLKQRTGVMLRGQWFPADVLDKKLQDIAEKYAIAPKR